MDLTPVHVLNASISRESAVPGKICHSECLFVFSARNSCRAEYCLRCELDAQVAETAETQYGHQISRSRATVTQARVDRGGVIWHECQRLRLRNHIVGVAAIAGETGNRGIPGNSPA